MLVRGPHVAAKLAVGAVIAAALALSAAVALADGGSPVTVYCTGATNVPDGVTPIGTGSPDLETTLQGVVSGETVYIDGFCTPTQDELFTIPDGVPFTLAGLPGTTSGFDGRGTSWPAPLLEGGAGPHSRYGAVGHLTLTDLTFENAVTTSAAPGGPAESALVLGLEAGITLTDDTFENDSDTDSSPVYLFEDGDGPDDGACSDAPISISGSTFEDNTVTLDSVADSESGGAGLKLVLYCTEQPVTLTDNTFSGNEVTSGTNYDPAVGAGLGLFASLDGDTVPVTQIGNVFDGNTITAPVGGNELVGGAGEWAGEINLTSTDDRFIDNVIPGTSGYGQSIGAGLAFGQVYNCDDASPHGTLVDDAVANNTIAMQNADTDLDQNDSGSSAEGAGVALTSYPLFYCADNGRRVSDAAQLTGPANSAALNLDDSTVVDNGVTNDGSVYTGAGATSGIFGEGGDLELDNSIVYGNVGGEDVDGFVTLAAPLIGGGVDPGSSVTASYSDVCNPDGTPYAGTGNICSDPELVNDSYSPLSGAARLSNASVSGSAATLFNVSETSSSPTIDAGSNAIVPSGLNTDLYGNQREVSRNCPVAAGTVDIGAAEFVPTCVTTTTTTTTTSTSTTTPAATTPVIASTTVPKVQACTSRRDVVMHLHYEFVIPPSVEITKVDATLTSSTVASFGTRHLTAFGSPLDKLRLNFKTLPYGTYRVHIHITLSNGTTAYQQRIWHTCRPFHWKYPIRHHPPRNTTRAAH